METNRRSSLRRKPLADCTNTIAAARRKSSPPVVKPPVADNQPPKPSNSAAAKVNSNPKHPTSIGYVKSNTSTGSNNPLSVDSIPHLADPPAPPTPLSDSGGRDRWKFGLAAAQSKRDENKRKVKGNMSSQTPVIQTSKPTVHQTPQRSSSAASDALKRKDKGKMILETPNVGTTDPLRPHVPLASSAASSNCHLAGPPVAENETLYAQKSKDTGKMILGNPNIEAIVCMRPHISLSSSFAALGNDHLSGPPGVENQNLDAQKRKAKGKMVLDTSELNTTDLLSPHNSLPSSSAASGSYLSGSPAIQNQDLDAQKRKDKGKAVLETPVFEITNLCRAHISLPSSSSAASGNFQLSGPSAIDNKKLDPQIQKDKGKRALENPNIETSESLRIHVPLASSSVVFDNCLLSRKPAVETQKLDASKSKDNVNLAQGTVEREMTDPLTPHVLASPSATAGTRHRERLVSWTVYNPRRASQRRKPIDETLSSYPKKRKKTVLEFGDDSGEKISGSHTDPLPLHKKQGRKKNDGSVHTMPQDEIERLRAYYAEIDAFELTEEVVSDSED